jgi:CheY-like chemotaxis protein
MSACLLPTTRLDPEGYVLLVIDDPFLRRTVRPQVAALGLPLQEGLSVRRALARVASARPSLVLLDLWVDHGEGLGFLESLRTRDPGRLIPVMLVGDDPRADVQLSAFSLGATGPIPFAEVARLGPWLEKALAS